MIEVGMEMVIEGIIEYNSNLMIDHNRIDHLDMVDRTINRIVIVETIGLIVLNAVVRTQCKIRRESLRDV